jgi:Tfp pilus assembly protein PilN
MMYPLNIDFVQRRPRSSWMALAVLGAGLALLAVALADHVDARDALAVADARLERLQARQKRDQALQRRGEPAVQVVAETPAVRNVVAQLNLPWDALLRELEQHADASVALISIESQGQGRSLRLTCEAESMVDVLAYVKRLGASPGIAAATLSGHEVRPSGAVQVVRFSLDVSWRGAR